MRYTSLTPHWCSSDARCGWAGVKHRPDWLHHRKRSVSRAHLQENNQFNAWYHAHNICSHHTGSENGIILFKVWLNNLLLERLINWSVFTCIGVRSIAQDGERGSESLATRAALGRWLGSTFGVDATDSLLSLAPILLCLVFANEKLHGL